jgi:hypothetical protein
MKEFKKSPINEYLEEIIKQDVSEHRKLLQRKVSHSIEIVSSEKYEGLGISEFMCFEFAFGILPSNVPIYKEVLDYQRG